ncbi:MAG: hypothetical protein K2H38_00800 [Muribaculaceae bacterium]|nr:hypothetical protein [Muribaculaceae bacterium]MDE6553575.1 hypothetical protein [Muribaculaceae bacterium]
MCQTALISRSIVRISARSFEQSLEAVSGSYVTHNKLLRLNNALDRLYDTVYDQFNDITPDDYKIIEPQLLLLLNTLKGLSNAYKKIHVSEKLSGEIDRLGRNYSALYELNNDIKNFRVKKISPELSSMLQKAEEAMKML